jgi:hypothetical protein
MMAAAYEVAVATLPGDPYPVFQVLRLDLIPPAGSKRKPPATACRYYQATVEGEELVVKRIGKLSDVRSEPVVRRVRRAAHGHGLWCTCPYDVCPHRRIWFAMGLPDPAREEMARVA